MIHSMNSIGIDDLIRAKQWLEANNDVEPAPLVLWPWEIKRLWPDVDVSGLKPGDVVTLTGQKVLVHGVQIPTG